MGFAQIGAVILPMLAALFVVANRANLAMRIVGSVRPRSDLTRPDDTAPDALSGRALHAIGFIGLSVCVILHNLCAIGQGLTVRFTWMTDPWYPSSGYNSRSTPDDP